MSDVSASGFLLSPEERRRFVDYCRQEASSLNSMMEQMQKLPNMPEGLVKHYNARRVAYTIVADDLTKVEDGSL